MPEQSPPHTDALDWAAQRGMGALAAAGVLYLLGWLLDLVLVTLPGRLGLHP